MDINTFLSNFAGGARTNRFVVEIESDGLVGPKTEYRGGTSKTIFTSRSSPAYTSGKSFPIHIRATKLPEMNMGIIPVNYRGKTVSFPGDRAVSNWEIIVLDDIIPGNANEHLHKAFIDWSRAITPTDTGIGTKNFDEATQWSNSGSGNIWKITQLYHHKFGTVEDTSTARTTKLYNCWPKEVGPLQFDMSTDNAINYFSVLLSFSHMDTPV